MTHDRRFRFGVQTSTASSGEEWAELARKAEDLGYATMFLPDHFGDQLAPVPAMAAAAAATTELRVGALVFDNETSTRSCWPRRWPPWTCSRAAGWRSASAPGGC